MCRMEISLSRVPFGGFPAFENKIIRGREIYNEIFRVIKKNRFLVILKNRLKVKKSFKLSESNLIFKCRMFI